MGTAVVGSIIPRFTPFTNLAQPETPVFLNLS